MLNNIWYDLLNLQHVIENEPSALIYHTDIFDDFLWEELEKNLFFGAHYTPEPSFFELYFGEGSESQFEMFIMLLYQLFIATPVVCFEILVNYLIFVINVILENEFFFFEYYFDYLFNSKNLVICYFIFNI